MRRIMKHRIKQQHTMNKKIKTKSNTITAALDAIFIYQTWGLAHYT